ncbi:YDG/SRA domain-containing protein [Kineosporia succinea]|uniref:Restriction endonuclease n=1 Tax=Kineosporia succinea TaxID=84632 RepID=A0ABT9P5D4_9ACTN|nr:YDG/SRA domain-containing protein [Kineosporia succinea]MDP9827903.1 putative restriction endonuclease [Kineosporia succinea]
MSEPSIFGHIAGHPTGSVFAKREDVRQARLHRHGRRGISGNYEEGADAICLSGGYKDDRDEGDWILYTGEGGQDEKKVQVEDQKDTQGNSALKLSETMSLPIRVIRGANAKGTHSPKSGFRYDGLYIVARHSYRASSDGPMIFQFELERVPEADGESWKETSARSFALTPPIGNTKPVRTAGVIQRVVRNTEVSQWVKQAYDSTCQICGVRLEIDGKGYAEGAHIRALGKPHNGPDIPANILCLCANDHVLFDRGALYIREGWVFLTANRTKLQKLRTLKGHDIKEAFTRYHRENFAQVRD